ncbi:MAG: hypothetical protein GF355_08790 [Candidatus Eisenbacteria bacterium]|nr:hypothetical protein [Candidatus Eisenbacteria bacterium]
MKTLLAVLTIALLAGSAWGQFVELGFRLDTEVIPYDGPDRDPCDDAVEAKWDDGSFENAYAWRYEGAQPPDYGAWGECYDGPYVCEVVFGFTQVDSDTMDATMDVYVWEDAGGLPGNVLCSLSEIDPGPVAFWPSVSFHPVEINCCADGAHFAGFWGDWPGGPASWYVASDEDGPGLGCPVTKHAPGMGYPTGWSPVLIPWGPACQDLGIREWYLESCPQPTPVAATTWGAIKSLY